jgi:hypothetical protein
MILLLKGMQMPIHIMQLQDCAAAALLPCLQEIPAAAASAHLRADSTADVHAEHVMPFTDSCKAHHTAVHVSSHFGWDKQLRGNPAPLTSALEGMLCTDTDEGAVAISVSATGSYLSRVLPSNCLSLSMACCCCCLLQLPPGTG